MTEIQRQSLMRLIEKVSNEVLEEMKEHFEKTDIPLGWMHSSLEPNEVNSIKKIIILDVTQNSNSYSDYFQCSTKIILDGKKILRIYEPTDTLDSMDYRIESILGFRVYLYPTEVEAVNFNPQW